MEKNRLPKALNKRNTIDLATSEKTLKEELFPFLEVRTKQSVKQGGYVYICVREWTRRPRVTPSTPLWVFCLLLIFT